MGVAEILKKELPIVRIIGIQPAGSKLTMCPGKPYPRSEISGGIAADILEEGAT